MQSEVETLSCLRSEEYPRYEARPDFLFSILLMQACMCTYYRFNTILTLCSRLYVVFVQRTYHAARTFEQYFRRTMSARPTSH